MTYTELMVNDAHLVFTDCSWLQLILFVTKEETSEQSCYYVDRETAQPSLPQSSALWEQRFIWPL